MVQMTWLVVLWVVIPGEWVEGAKLPDGSKLKYKMNGFSSMLVRDSCSVPTTQGLRYLTDSPHGHLLPIILH